MKLNNQAILFVIIPIMAFTIIFSVIDYVFHSKDLLDSTVKNVESLSKITSLEMTNPMYHLDVDKLNEIIDNLESQPEVVQILVLYPDGRLLTDGTDKDYEYGVITQDDFLLKSIGTDEKEILVTNDLIRAYCPIFLNEKIGILSIDYSLSTINETIFYSQLRIGTIAGILIGIFLPISLKFSRSISLPILKIKNLLGKISKGEFEIEQEKFKVPEIQELSDGIHEMNRKLQNLQKEIIQNERLSTIGELSARVSHDLRNPLATIKNSIELIKIHDPELIKKHTKYFDSIDLAIDRMNMEINSVLLHAKNKPTKKSLQDFSEILENAINSVKIPDNISIEKPKTGTKIFCDSVQMENVLINLISNANHAISSNRGKITIMLTSEEGFDKITISDNGPGIKEESLDIIFEPLYTTKQYGTGLGLVNCRNIINSHGGKISVENLPEGGAKFTILLPKNKETV